MSNYDDLLNGFLPSSEGGSSQDYTNLTGSDLINNGSFLDDLRTYYGSKGQSFATTSDMLDEWYTDQRWKSSNFLSAGLDMMEYNNAGSDQALMARLSKAWQNAPERGTTFEKVKDYGLATIADPVNLIPYAGAASKASRVAKAAQASGLTKNAATKAAMKAGAKRGLAIEGSVGAGMGAGFEALQQSRQIQQGLRDEYDAGQIGKAAAIEGAFSGAIGAPLGAIASKAPAQRALEWQQGTPLGEKLNSRMTELADAERIAQAEAADDTLPVDVRNDAKNDLLDIEKERADVQAAVNKAVQLEKELENTAKQLEVAKTDGADTTALQADYENKYRVFAELIASTDVERVTRLDNQTINKNRKDAADAAAAAATAAKAPKAAKAVSGTKGKDTEAPAGPTEEEVAEARTVAADAEAQMKEEGTEATEATDTEGTVEVQEEAAASAEPKAEAPKVPEVRPVPDLKAVKFNMSKSQSDSFEKGWGKNGATHKNKVKKANEKNGTDHKPLTRTDLGKIVASVENGVDKNGKLTNNGMRAIREYMAALEDRPFRSKSKPMDESNYTDPNVAAQAKAKEDAAAADAKAQRAADTAAEKSDITDVANAVFDDIIKGSGYLKTRKVQSVRRYFNAVLNASSDEGIPMTKDVAAAVRRRLDTLENDVHPIYDNLKSQQQVAKFKAELNSRAATDDLKATPGRVADRSAKVEEALSFEKYAGRVFQNYIDPKTGEKRTTSKINSLFRAGMDIGDGYTITEGADALQKRNMTREENKAQAAIDFAQGKLRAIYPFKAKAGMRIRGGNLAEEGQEVFGVYIPKSDRFEVFPSEEAARVRAGISKSNKDNPIVHVDPNKGISVREDFERMMDEAEQSFEKHGDISKLNEEQELLKARGRVGGLDVDDPAPTKVVDGKGNDVTDVQELPDVSPTRGEKVLILLPKTLEVKPRVLSHGYEDAQLERGAGLEVLLGKGKIEDFNVGYVPMFHNDKKITSRTDRDILKGLFEPFDENNDIGKQPAPKKEKPKLPEAPMDYEETTTTVVDIKRLASTPEGEQLAKRLWIGSRLIDGGTNIEETLDDFLVSKPRLSDLDAVLTSLESQDMRVNLVGTEAEVPFQQRLNAIQAYLQIEKAEAPLGIRRPAQDIEKSLEELRKLTGSMNQTTFGYIEKMMRAILPDNKAPIFRSLKDHDLAKGDFFDDTNGLFQAQARSYAPLKSFDMADLDATIEGNVIIGDDFNKVFLDPEKMDHDGTRSGMTTSFVVMHELGHWAYQNLLTPEMKLEFWQAVGDHYYDAGGKFDGGFVSNRVQGTLLDAHSPLVELDGIQAGAANAHKTAGEVFANQFALWAHHKYEAPLHAKSFFDKAAAVIKKLWNHITNRHIVDKRYEAIFEKMIADKSEALEKRFMMPVEHSTNLGGALRTRYNEINAAVHAFEEAREGYPDMHDPEKMAMAARMIANAFSSITMGQRERGILARRGAKDGKISAAEQVLINRHTGAFKAIKGHTRMKQYAEEINKITASTDYTVSQTGDDMIIGGSAFHSDMEKDIVELWDKGLGKYARGKLEQINEAYLDVEYGDIPEAQLSETVLSLRQTNSLSRETLEKSKNFKQKVRRVTNANRAKFEKTMSTIMKDQGKANAKEFSGEVVKGTKGTNLNNYSLTEALAEYRRQIDKDGNPTEFGKKLSSRVKHLVNTETKDVVLTEEEQLIFNKLQSKEKTGGNQGLAISSTQPQLTLALSMSADGEVIKGFGASPEQATNILKHLIRTRKKNRATKQSDSVKKAIIIEQAQDAGTAFENGVPANATIKMREYLRGITHRDNDIELTARTVTARLARIGSESLPQTVDASSYGSYRKAVRTVGTNLARSEDITQAVQFVGEALYSSHAVSHASRNVISKASAVFGIPPEKIFAEILAETTDINSSKPQLKAVANIMDGEDADLFAEFIDELDNEISEAAGYVLNGMIKKPAARERFAGITAYGDMIGSARLTKGSPRTRYADRVPAEYAEDFASEITSDFTQAGYAAVREFTGDKIIPYYRNGVTSDGIFGVGNYVTNRPMNTVNEMRDDIVSAVPADKKEEATDLVNQIAMVRAKVNTARLDADASSVYLDKMYVLDDVLTDELQNMGAAVNTTVEPVFIRDTQPAIFANKMTGNHPIVKSLISHMQAEGRVREANALDQITGVMTGEDMARRIAGVLGGTRKFKRAMKDAGFTSLNLGETKLMLSTRDIRNIRSDTFENATPIIGEGSQMHSVNGRILQSAEADNAIKILGRAATELEEAGVPPKTLEAMISVARGRGMPSEAAAEIRKSNIFNPFRTNSKIMDRSGISWLSGFFEPKDGSAGHFERTNARMGKFVIPLTKLLKDLPDSKNKLVTYWRTGPQMMAESAMGAMGINPKRRMSQPASHTRILNALRGSSDPAGLLAEERKVYDHIRGYLDEAIGRLRASGALVGNIKKNYFPQVWRKDLIQADPEEFVRRLSRYFLAERNGTGDATQAEAAARRVMQRLIDEDGVFSNPAQNFKRMSDKAGDQSDHLDYNRLIRLDEFPEFADVDVPDSLGVFLENDVLVAMTKYSDNLEHRIDIANEFGVGAHGYHDYMSVISQPMNARQVIGTLLSTNKIITTSYVRSGMTDQGVKEMKFDNNYFYAPIKQKFEAEQKAQELIDLAKDGKGAAEIEANIMALLGDDLNGNPDADILRGNFRKRAKAIAAALADTKGMTEVPSNDNLKHAQGFMNASMRRPVDGVHGTYSMVNASKWLRGVNAVTLLGFTTLTSLGDLILPLIRTGDLGSYAKSLRKFATDPEYRDMIRNIGAATENAVHQRLTVAHGVDSTQFMTGFFNSTLLTPWTDMMRDVAAAVSYEHVKAQHKILKNRPNSRAGRIARRILREEGLAEFIEDQSLDMDLIMESRFTGNEHPLANKLASSTIKLTNQMIFTPNPNDIPLWAQTPLGAIAFQLKSYPIMMTRLVNTVAGEAFRGDTVAERGANFAKAFVGQSDNRLGPLAALLVAGPAMGGVAVGAKDIVQGRGGEDNREFELRERKLSETLTDAFAENEDMDMLLGWYFDGMVALGGLGLMGELMYDIASQTDNGAYGAQRILETVGGPSVGLFNDATTVLQGGRSWWDGKEANGERRAAVREIAGRIPVLGGVSWAKEGIVDTIAGERGAGNKKSGWGGGWGGGWG